jgi:hypothetical protein
LAGVEPNGGIGCKGPVTDAGSNAPKHKSPRIADERGKLPYCHVERLLCGVVLCCVCVVRESIKNSPNLTKNKSSCKYRLGKSVDILCQDQAQ